MLRHGRFLFDQAAGDLGAHPPAQVEEHQGYRSCDSCHGLPGCVMQIGGGFDQDKTDVKVKHTLELLVDQLK